MGFLFLFIYSLFFSEGLLIVIITNEFILRLVMEFFPWAALELKEYRLASLFLRLRLRSVFLRDISLILMKLNRCQRGGRLRENYGDVFIDQRLLDRQTSEFFLGVLFICEGYFFLDYRSCPHYKMKDSKTRAGEREGQNEMRLLTLEAVSLGNSRRKVQSQPSHDSRILCDDPVNNCCLVLLMMGSLHQLYSSDQMQSHL